MLGKKKLERKGAIRKARAQNIQKDLEGFLWVKRQKT